MTQVARRIVRGAKMGKYLWLAVDADEYELPLYVADSARELAEKFNMNPHTLECNAWYGHNGRISGRKFVKVLKDD